MKTIALAAAALLASAFGGSALACEGYSVDTVQSAGQSYDPAQLTTQLVQISIHADGMAQDCVPLAASVRARGGAGRIVLQRLGDSLQARPVRSALVASANATEIEITTVARRDLAGEGRILLDLLEIDAGQFVPVGDYVADLEWVVEGQAPHPFQIAVRVEPSVRFVGDGVTQLSLGEVSDGGEVRSSFLYATNANLRVSARSEHGGRLEHELGPNFGSIPYVAYLSGQRLDLASPTLVTLILGRAGLKSEELRVDVQPQQGRYAGSYKDTLTLNFVAY